MAIYLSKDEAARGDTAARVVVRYNVLMQMLADRAKQPDFRPSEWEQLGEVVAITEFRRFGNFMEQQNWAEYLAMLQAWASSMSFSSEFKSMTSSDNRVFLQLEENNGGHIINSLSVYDINADAKLVNLYIYLQSKPSSPGE